MVNEAGLNQPDYFELYFAFVEENSVTVELNDNKHEMETWYLV